VYLHPRMPYTRALLAAMPVPGGPRPTAIAGELPSPANPPSGCHFRTRCTRATGACAEQLPQLTEIAPQHWAACLRLNESEGG
jgi:peptide/nickel transport system ATP-binding protein